MVRDSNDGGSKEGDGPTKKAASNHLLDRLNLFVLQFNAFLQ